MKTLIKIKYLLKNNQKLKKYNDPRKRIKKLLNCIKNMVMSEN